MSLTSAPVAPFHSSLHFSEDRPCRCLPCQRQGQLGGPVHWTDLKRGDGIRHRDYGLGTIDSAGPVWLLITWDEPNGFDYHWPEALAPHLTRLATPTPETQTR